MACRRPSRSCRRIRGPIVIVSSESREGADSTLRALELGAIDFVPKPSSGIDLDMQSVREELTRKLKMSAKVRVVRTATRSSNSDASPRQSPLSSSCRLSGRGRTVAWLPTDKVSLVVIAASTGGPATVMRAWRGLPQGFARCRFPRAAHARCLYHAIRRAARRNLRAPREGSRSQRARLSPARFTFAPASHHLRVHSTGRIALDAARASMAIAQRRRHHGICRRFRRPDDDRCRPHRHGQRRRKGRQSHQPRRRLVIAQDEATSVIFGMPAEAIKTGTVKEILALDEICSAIEKRVAASQTRSSGSTMPIAAQDGIPAPALARAPSSDLVPHQRPTFAIAAVPSRKFAASTPLPERPTRSASPKFPKSATPSSAANTSYYVVNGGAHFGLPSPARSRLVLAARAAVLVDGIERMTEISRLHALPQAFTTTSAIGIAACAYLTNGIPS